MDFCTSIEHTQSSRLCSKSLMERCMYKFFCWPFRDPGWDAYFIYPEKKSALNQNCFLFVQRKMLVRTLLLIGIVQAVVFSVPVKNKKDKGNVNNYFFISFLCMLLSFVPCKISDHVLNLSLISFKYCFFFTFQNSLNIYIHVHRNFCS